MSYCKDVMEAYPGRGTSVWVPYCSRTDLKPLRETKNRKVETSIGVLPLTYK